MAITEYVNPAVHEGDDLLISKAGNGGFVVWTHPGPSRGGFAATTPIAASTAADMMAMLALLYGVTPSEIARALDAIERRLPKKARHTTAGDVGSDARIEGDQA